MNDYLKVINAKKDWNNFLSQMESFDCYHTYDYHQIDKEQNEETVLLTYEDQNIKIALPLVVRLIEGTPFKDATSVYGYSGPLSSQLPPDFNNERFVDLLVKWFNDQGIISIFSRLNPYIQNQEKILKGMGELRQLGKVVNIDLTRSIEEQRTQFSSTTKRYLNKVRRSCYTEISTKQEDLRLFIDLYYENMKRVNASDSYFFNPDYFKSFLNASDFDTELLVARLKETDEIISAALMLKTNQIIQYHLSGTKDEYLGLTPIRLLIDQTRITGTQDGFSFFNLGGGLGGKEDNLFYFKSSFSKDFRIFRTWNYIVNRPAYKSLCDAHINLDPSVKSPDYFPLYRFKG